MYRRTTVCFVVGVSSCGANARFVSGVSSVCTRLVQFSRSAPADIPVTIRRGRTLPQTPGKMNAHIGCIFLLFSTLTVAAACLQKLKKHKNNNNCYFTMYFYRVPSSVSNLLIVNYYVQPWIVKKFQNRFYISRVSDTARCLTSACSVKDREKVL